ncbi:hypothetical protein FRC06_002041 [Ceratobasidium sp. 370]|nr:hypothetical protein FRC06_002041 [Ceratobasidium sp. 370]
MTFNLRPEPLFPLEILLSILEVHFAADSWESALAKPHRFLLIDRTIRNRLLGMFYRTVVLRSSTQLALFSETIRSSPHLGKLVSNIWVCTSVEVGVSGHKRVGSTLSLDLLSTYTPNLQRLALPKLVDNMSAIAPKKQSLLPRLHTLYVHSMPSRTFFLYGISEHLENLRRLSVTLPPENEGGDYEISSGLWAIALVAAIDDRPTRIKELILNVPAHPTNKACAGGLSSINAVGRFYYTLQVAPHLSEHVKNIWIGTSQLHAFDTWDYPFRLVETNIESILDATKNVERVAIPYAYFPRAGFPSVTHLATTNDLFPPITPFLRHLESLYIHGLPSRDCVNTILTRFGNVRRVSIRAPLAREKDAAAFTMCARTMMLFRGRLKNLIELELIVNEGTARVLKEGMKKTLEGDPRIRIWKAWDTDMSMLAFSH